MQDIHVSLAEAGILVIVGIGLCPSSRSLWGWSNDAMKSMKTRTRATFRMSSCVSNQRSAASSLRGERTRSRLGSGSAMKHGRVAKPRLCFAASSMPISVLMRYRMHIPGNDFFSQRAEAKSARLSSGPIQLCLDRSSRAGCAAR